MEHLRLVLHGRPALGAPQGRGAPLSRFAWQLQHLEHQSLFCMAGAALDASQLGIAGHFFKAQTCSKHPHNTIYTTSSNTPSSRQHHLHNIINTISSTQPHQRITIYTTPSTEHHLHYIIKHLQVQHLEHCHISPSASFLLIPLLLFFVVDCSLFSFIDLFRCWMSEDTVNMWGYPVL